MAVLTWAAQKVGKLWHTAIKIKPKVANMVMTRKPSARPQRSKIFAKGIYTAADMALATI